MASVIHRQVTQLNSTATDMFVGASIDMSLLSTTSPISLSSSSESNRTGSAVSPSLAASVSYLDRLWSRIPPSFLATSSSSNERTESTLSRKSLTPCPASNPSEIGSSVSPSLASSSMSSPSRTLSASHAFEVSAISILPPAAATAMVASQSSQASPSAIKQHEVQILQPESHPPDRIPNTPSADHKPASQMPQLDHLGRDRLSISLPSRIIRCSSSELVSMSTPSTILTKVMQSARRAWYSYKSTMSVLSKNISTISGINHGWTTRSRVLF